MLRLLHLIIIHISFSYSKEGSIDYLVRINVCTELDAITRMMADLIGGSGSLVPGRITGC